MLLNKLSASSPQLSGAYPERSWNAQLSVSAATAAHEPHKKVRKTLQKPLPVGTVRQKHPKYAIAAR